MQIKVNNLEKKFGKQVALDKIDLVFENSSRTALVGPNGSGKSTLMRALMGTIHCQGDVYFNDLLLKRPPALDHTIAYIPQFAPQTRAPVQDLLDTVCCLRELNPDLVMACADELNFDLAANLEKEVGNLSGGMRQKLMISMAMAAPVDLLVMDEPTASLDSESRSAFMQMFDRVTAETTVILASHRSDELRSLVDNIVLLREGAVAYHGDARSFLARSTRTVIELRCDENGGHDWLRDMGFKQVHPQQWVGAFPSDNKEQILNTLGWKRKPSVHDIIVHDVEHVEFESSENCEKVCNV
jgi:ABC-type multidrug transport system ATPase subunit